MDEVRIPKERIAILIGKKGETKREISKATNTKIKVDSNEGDVIITGEDGLNVYNAKKIIQAIGRGFNPKKALQLLEEDEIFEMINMRDYARNSKDDRSVIQNIVSIRAYHQYVIYTGINLLILMVLKIFGVNIILLFFLSFPYY